MCLSRFVFLSTRLSALQAVSLESTRPCSGHGTLNAQGLCVCDLVSCECRAGAGSITVCFCSASLGKNAMRVKRTITPTPRANTARARHAAATVIATQWAIACAIRFVRVCVHQRRVQGFNDTRCNMCLYGHGTYPNCNFYFCTRHENCRSFCAVAGCNRFGFCSDHGYCNDRAKCVCDNRVRAGHLRVDRVAFVGAGSIWFAMPDLFRSPLQLPLVQILYIERDMQRPRSMQFSRRLCVQS